MIKEKLKKDYELLIKQRELLSYSYNKCKSLPLQDHSQSELESFETLCARYSRGIDFLIRKIFRTIDEYEFENQGTLIDVVNNAHKRGNIDSVESIRAMKELRNMIMHEYITQKLETFFNDVLVNTSTLINIMDRTITYISQL